MVVIEPNFKDAPLTNCLATRRLYSAVIWWGYERRETSDDRTLGGLHFLFADEVRDLDFQTALQQRMSLFLDMTLAKHKKSKTFIFCQLLE